MQEQIIKKFEKLIIPACFQTIRMVTITMVMSIVIGSFIAIILVLTNPKGLKPNKKIYSCLSAVVNTIKSLPFILLVISIAPITRFFAGSIVGTYAAIIPMTIGGIPLIAKIIENSLIEVNPQLIEAAQSYGASPIQIVFGVMIKESIPNLINGLTLCTVNGIAATTMAGVVGAGGLGSVALNYGFYGYDNFILYTCILLIIFMVSVVQGIGNIFYKLSNIHN